MSETLKYLKTIRRQVLKELYDQCSPAEQAFFCRMYESVEKIPDEKIDWAIQQCERTLKNKTGEVIRYNLPK